MVLRRHSRQPGRADRDRSQAIRVDEMNKNRSPGAGPRHPIERGRAIAVAAVVGVLLFAGLVSIVASAYWRSSGHPPTPQRAAIVDQLALTDPNGDFVASATRELESAGYQVDYYPSDAITVDFYRDLPARGYRFIVLRSHTSDYRAPIRPSSGSQGPEASTGLFTNELYSRLTHIEDQYAARLMVDAYADRDIPWKYFGITPEFILHSTRGRFQGTTIVLMGCSGLKTDDLAQAFLARGAKDFVSWDQSVTAEHTDAATKELLVNLFDKGRDLREAVASTMDDVGPDPSFGSRLTVYP
jgi:hypothetical protein